MFSWIAVPHKDGTLSPSPRQGQSGWDFRGELWIFGGYGPEGHNYLNENGHYSNSCNNQLLGYNFERKEWKNPKSFGTVPSPRRNMATATRGNKVWLFGGYDNDTVSDELFQLDMCTFTWTQIQTGHPKPKGRCLFSLTAVQDNQLVLHGGATSNSNIFNTFKDTWILDEASHLWKQYKSDYDERFSHTGTSSIGNNVIIVGGAKKSSQHFRYSLCKYHLYVMLEPKSLQQLAMTMLWHHQRKLPWKKCLPKKLIQVMHRTANSS